MTTAVGTFRLGLATLAPPVSATFSVAAIGTSPRTFAAKDNIGRPALIVETHSATSREVVRRGLRLQHRASCFVEISGVTQTITASLIVCEAEDIALQEAFISVGEIVLSRLSAATEAEVAELLEELVELLERPGEPSREAAIGLFAELLILSLARDPVTAVRSWRIGTADRYDIVCGTCGIEVKASGTRERRHHFSLEQCIPDKGSRVIVASTLVLEGSGGTGVRELASRVQEMVKTDADLTMKIQRAVFTSMGFPRPGEPIFDEAHAIDKLRWYDICDIPAIRVAPEHVDQIQFRVDLATTSELSRADLESSLPAIRPCLPLC